MGAGSELQKGWADLGVEVLEQAERDAIDLEQHGIARVPYDLVVATERDAALVIGAVQLRRDTARRLREQAEQMAVQAELDADRLLGHFEGQLRQFATRALEGQKAKSLKLVTGHGGDKPTRVGFRKVPGGLRVVDNEKAIAWAFRERESPGDTNNEEADAFNRLLDGLLKEVPAMLKPVADGFKAWYETTHEIPDGCEVVDDEDKFFFK